MNFKVTLLLSVCLLMIPKLIFAHGSGHTEEQIVSPLIEEDPLLMILFILLMAEKKQSFKT